MEHFSAPTNTEAPTTPQSRTHHAMFPYLFPDDIQQDTATTTVHRKCIIELLNQRNVLSSKISTIWENTDGCAEH